MTIAERKAREAHDRENPWRPINTARPDGTICELLFNDMAGDFRSEEHRFFLDHDRTWYRIGPPSKVWPWPSPMNWRPAYVKLTPEKRNYIKHQAKRYG